MYISRAAVCCSTVCTDLTVEHVGAMALGDLTEKYKTSRYRNFCVDSTNGMLSAWSNVACHYQHVCCLMVSDFTHQNGVRILVEVVFSGSLLLSFRLALDSRCFLKKM